MFSFALARLSRFTRYGPGRSRLSLEIEKWLLLNYWSPDQFATLTRLCCPAAKALTAREVARILSGSMLELMPKHFQAFAQVEQLVHRNHGAPMQGASDQDLLACFASSICSDDSAQQASWWFALYCNEAWALERIRESQPLPSLDLGVIGKLLPGLLRKAVARHGLDPIGYVREAVQRLPAGSRIGRHTFIDWILEYDRLDGEGVRLALPFVLMLLRELGSDCRVLADVPLLSAAEVGPAAGAAVEPATEPAA